MRRLRYISLIIATIILMGTVGCTQNQGDPSDSSIQEQEEPSEMELKESPYYLTKNKISEYTIVYPEDVILGTHTDFAVTELQTFIYQATGVSLNAVKDTGLTYSDGAKYLAVGETSIFEGAGLTLNKKALKDSGYIVKSKGESVFMVGGSFGTLNAVYDFLKYQFNFEVYATDEIAIDDCKNKDVKLYEYDIVEVPDINSNVGTYGEMYNDREYTLRMRMQQFSDVFLPENGAWHNFLGVVNPLIYNDPNRCTVEGDHDCINDSTATDKNIEDYTDCEAGDYHPEWFSNGQLNLSGETSDLLVEVVVEKWKSYVETSIEKTQLVWTFTQMDTGTWSTADSSKALKEIYGTHSAEYILFMNRCAEKMNAWLDVNYPEKEYGYLIFSYQETTQAPIKQENGKYEPIDQSVVMAENVRLFYTTISADYYHPITSKQNQSIRTRLEEWKAVMNGQEMALWMYGSYYDSYLVPMDLSNCLQENFQWAKDENCSLMFYQMQSDQPIATDWSRLNMYLISKLGQDVNADVNKLTDDFFVNYFKDANSSMRKLYNETRVWLAHIAETDQYKFGIAGASKLNSRQYWPYRTLLQWLGYIDQAYKDIEHYKHTDLSLYDKLYDRITLESITIRYLLLNCYSVRIDDSSKYAKELMNDCLALGITQAGENETRKIVPTLSKFI